jgi:toxin-antitoxin system PIN domain toxin
VVLVDANILLHVANPSAAEHATAKRWIEQALSGTEAIGFAWIVVLAFLRVATRPPVFVRPLTIDEASDLIDEWLAATPTTLVQPTSRHVDVLRGLLRQAGTAGNLVSDAHLAALAIEHGARICSFDRDFARFPGVRVFAPA